MRRCLVARQHSCASIAAPPCESIEDVRASGQDEGLDGKEIDDSIAIHMLEHSLRVLQTEWRLYSYAERNELELKDWLLQKQNIIGPPATKQCAQSLRL